MIRVSNKRALLSAIKRSKNEVALLIGSPLSTGFKSNEKGVPNVKGVLDIIEEYVASDSELHSEYKQEIGEKYPNDNERYQKSFEFLADYTDPDTLNIIIRKAVLCATKADNSNIDLQDIESLNEIQNDTEQWKIPSATTALAKIIVENTNFTGPVLTSNFDPLLSIALSKLDHEPNRIVLHGDGSLEHYQSTNINIVHFHGFWTNTDTLHTQSQLKASRPKLKASLSRILRNKTLVVLGYGGWDDIFTHALRDVMDDDSANFDIIWAFYEKEPETIEKRYEQLIKSVQPAIGRNRFRMYGGIDCHEFLNELQNHLIKPADEVDKKHTKNTLKVIDAPDLDLSPKFIDSDTIIPEWSIYADLAHNYIREVERSEIIDILNNEPYVNLVCDWGISKDEFISTLTTEKNSPYHAASLYKLNIESVDSKEKLLDSVEQEFGCGLQTFISHMSANKTLLCLDGFDSSLPNKEKNEIFRLVMWLAEMLTEYNPLCKVIICSRTIINKGLHSVQLNKLEEFDVRSYITHHSQLQGEPDEKMFESLNELSKGIPAFIDKYIAELEIFSIDDLYDSHFSPEAYRHDSDSVFPNELKQRIKALNSNQGDHSSRSYELLNVLSILDNGDSFTNLKRSNSQFNYRMSHLKELYSLELVESTSLKNNFLGKSDSYTEEKLHHLSPMIREYVYSRLTTKKIYEIVKQLAVIHLGKDWRSGTLNLCALTQDLLAENSKATGSTYIILIHLLRCSIELNNSRGIESALRICESYCSLLSNKSKHREQVKFIDQIRTIIKESTKASLNLKFDEYEGESLRMTDQDDKAEKVLVSVYNKLKEQKEPEKSILKSVLVSLALIYESENDYPNSHRMAKEILEIDSKHYHARLIVAETSEHTSIVELKDLENHFRNKNQIVIANNAALALFDLEVTNKAKLHWIERILSGKTNSYNKYRAIVQKGILLINEGNEFSLSQIELRLLHASYIYSFSQKMSWLFNQSHQVLWHYYISRQNYSIIFQMFQQSSLFWRIYGNNENESKYSAKLFSLLKNLLPESIDLSKHKYVTFRVKQIDSRVINPKLTEDVSIT